MPRLTPLLLAPLPLICSCMESEAGGSDVPLVVQGDYIDAPFDPADLQAEPDDEDLATISDPAEYFSSPAEPEDLTTKDVLTFADVSLPDETVDLLLDSLFEGVGLSEDEFEVPEHIAALDGREVTFQGYMIPTKWEGSKVRGFMLVGDLLACCFGGTPQPDEWIDVSMKSGSGTKYLPYIAVSARGTFSLTSEMPEGGFVIGVYGMECDLVERVE